MREARAEYAPLDPRLHSFIYVHAPIRVYPRTECIPYLPLPFQPKLVLIYRHQKMES